MATLTAERHITLNVRVSNGHVSRNGNYFVSAVVQLVTAAAPPSASSTPSVTSSLILPTNIQRTDVCKNTSNLIFRNQIFKFAFRLPEPSPTSSEVGKATLLVRLFEIAPAPKTQPPTPPSSGPIADTVYELNFPSSGTSTATTTLHWLPCSADTPRSTDSSSSDQSVEDFGNISLSLQMNLVRCHVSGGSAALRCFF